MEHCFVLFIELIFFSSFLFVCLVVCLFGLGFFCFFVFVVVVVLFRQGFSV